MNFHSEQIIRKERIVAWANTHDTGAPVTAVLLDCGAMEIHGTEVHPDGRVMPTRDLAHSLEDVRAILGY